MQITQELCKRPGLNKAGFEMPTIYIPTLLDKVTYLLDTSSTNMSFNTVAWIEINSFLAK